MKIEVAAINEDKFIQEYTFEHFELKVKLHSPLLSFSPKIRDYATICKIDILLDIGSRGVISLYPETAEERDLIRRDMNYVLANPSELIVRFNWDEG